MKILRLLLPVLLTAVVFACKNDPKQAALNSAPPAIDNEVAMAKKAAYLCPMDCEKGKLYEQPGQCPVCKMDLTMATADQIRHAATEVAAAAETTNLPVGDPNKSLETEVNTLHDQSMKDMAEMERVGRQVKAEFKTVQGDEARKSYVKSIAETSRAGMDMMAWMRDYRAPSDLPAAEASRYLNEQKAKLQRLHSAILAATTNAQKVVKTSK